MLGYYRNEFVEGAVRKKNNKLIQRILSLTLSFKKEFLVTQFSYPTSWKNCFYQMTQRKPFKTILGFSKLLSC